MTKPVYPAVNNQQAVDLNILNSNVFHNIVNGDATTDVQTYEGNGTVPSVLKALTTMAAYKAPIDWQSGSVENDILQPRVYTDLLFVPIKVPAPMGDTPTDSHWKLYMTDVSSLLTDKGYNYYREVVSGSPKSTFTVPFDIGFFSYGDANRPQANVFVNSEKIDMFNITYVDNRNISIVTPVAVGAVVEIYSLTTASGTMLEGLKEEAAASAADAEETLKDFRNIYYGSRSSDPTTRPDGSAMQDGDLYKNTATTTLRVYVAASGIWVDASTGSVSLLTSVKDFGAVGDGVTDDTASILEALKHNRVFVPLGTYNVSPFDGIERLYGYGSLVYNTGKIISLSSVGSEDSLRVTYHGEMRHEGSNSAPQAIGYCTSVSGNDTFFYIQDINVGTSSNWEKSNIARINWYNTNDLAKNALSINTNASSEDGDVIRSGYKDFCGLGHGAGCEPCVIDGVQYIISGVYEGDGYSKIKWNGVDTTYDDITYIKGLSGVSLAQVSISSDGRKLVFVSNVAENYGDSDGKQKYYKCLVYDRLLVESALIPDGSKSFNDEYGNPVILNNVYTSNAEPELVFNVPLSTSKGGISGVCCDGKYIYTLFSRTEGGAQSTIANIRVYSMAGILVKTLSTNLCADILGTRFTGAELTSNDKRPISVEFEGLSIHKNRLFVGVKCNVGVPSAYVSFNGNVYYPSSDVDAGINPNNSPWERTDTPSDLTSISEYDAGSSYLGISDSVGHMYLCAITANSNDLYSYPLGARSFSNRIIDASSGPFFGSSSNGNSSFLGTYYDRAETLMPYIEASNKGVLTVHDSDYELQNGYTNQSVGFLRYNGSVDLFELRAGNRALGSRLELRGKDAVDANSFSLIAGTGTDNPYEFKGKQDGNLYWKNEKVLTDTKTPTINLSGVIKTASETKSLNLYGGTNTSSPSIFLRGTNYGTASLKGAIELCTYSSENSPALQLYPNGTITWNGQSLATASDERLKMDFASVSDDVLDAWSRVNWIVFRFRKAVESKGESARFHTGLVAQRIKDAFESVGMNACVLGILCHDEWNNEYDNDGNIVRPAGDIWTVRYEEALCLEAAYQRRRADRLEERIKAIEAKLGEINV